MPKIATSYFKSPYGEFIIGDYQGKLCLCDWRFRKMRTTIDARICKYLDTEYSQKSTPLIEETIRQLQEYFRKERKVFELPLLLAGTDFQKEVWTRLLEIPYGETTTYASLSKEMNKELAIRAISSANGANAISILTPCHRVIGSDGKLVGYAGGLETKKKLLHLEGAKLNSNQLNLF
jgi:methylated-DNA-[protein]-cysteine S-methyltransferase